MFPFEEHSRKTRSQLEDVRVEGKHRQCQRGASFLACKWRS